MNKKQAENIIKIRVFEEEILDLFSQNKLSGTTHTYIGQEAVAVAVMNYIKENDKVFSNHRCHGHYLAYGGDIKSLLAEIMSKQSGLCQGRGGSQHIHYKNFYTNGIQGGIVPNALGMAWADKLLEKDGITVVFLGDGTLGQGIVYESFNMASLYNIPILFVIENNKYAMSTSTDDAVSGSIIKRAQAFDIECSEVESNDISILDSHFEKAVEYIRQNNKPFCQIVHTYRLAAHSKGDDTRDKTEIDDWRKKDPIIYVENTFGKKFCEDLKKKFRKEIQDIIIKLEKENNIEIEIKSKNTKKTRNKPVSFLNREDNKKVLTCINNSLDKLMLKYKNIILLGEDIRNPYGGAFKVTKDLSHKYPDRVINTPISEAAIAGSGVGLALNGIKPIIEIMFGDFVTLCFDQILNHATKYQWIYGSDIELPLIFRLPMGAGRGYGPTHSQSLEKYLVGIPQISILATSNIFDIEKLYCYAIENCKSPLIIIENKKMYGNKLYKTENSKIMQFDVIESFCNNFPSVKLSLDKENKADVTIITYGGMLDEALEASLTLMIQDEIQLDIIVITQLSPIPMEDLNLLINSDYIGTLEEGTICNGIGAEIISKLAEKNIGKNYFRLATPDFPIPNGIKLEQQIIPNKNTIIDKVRSLYNEN